MKDLRIPDMDVAMYCTTKKTKKQKRKRLFKAKWVKLPTRWITALRRSGSASTLQLALTILLEDFRREYCGGEIVLSAHTTRMPSATTSRAARELVELGLVKLKQTGRGALRVTWVAS